VRRALISLSALSLLAAVAGCAADAVVDLSVEAWDARAVSQAEVVVCNARDRSEILENVILAPSSPATVTLQADGSAVAFAATTPDGLCGATCQVELDPDASIRTALVLHPCVVCPTLEASAVNVCRDPLCFMTEPELSGCE
jgi:hypothetical protein